MQLASLRRRIRAKLAAEPLAQCLVGEQRPGKLAARRGSRHVEPVGLFVQTIGGHR